MELNEIFINDIKNSIENAAKNNNRLVSKQFKPSNMHCSRAMYYMGKGYKQIANEVHYNWINAADTGSRRHEGIQDTLLQMTNEENTNWKYIDVGEYIKQKQLDGKCLDIRVGDKKGAETHLYNDKLNLSFFCDGIVQYVPTGEYLLFEFKNKKSEKYQYSKYEFPMEHYDQVVIYCDVLDLDKALLLMEDRNTLELSCPVVFNVTQEMKLNLENKINNVLNCLQTNTLPEKIDNTNQCYFCPYKIYCDEDENNV